MDRPLLFWAKTNLSEAQDTDINGVEVTSKSLRLYMMDSGLQQDPDSEAYCRITLEEDPLSVLVVYSLKHPCQPGQPPRHLNRTVHGMSERAGWIRWACSSSSHLPKTGMLILSVLNSPVMGPLIIFACARTPEGATRMVDITPRDIRRVTAFFTFYREGNLCVRQAYHHVDIYPFLTGRAVMLSDGKDEYNLEMGVDSDLVMVQEVQIPVHSPHSSYPISLAFAIGLPWYIRRIAPMGTDAECPSPTSMTMEKRERIQEWNSHSPLRWSRHVTYMDPKGPLRDRQQRPFTSKKVLVTGSAVILSGKLHHISVWYLWMFNNYMDACFDRDIMPSEWGFKGFWEANSTIPSPYDADKGLGSEDAFAPGKEGDDLRNAARENIARVWRAACHGYDRNKTSKMGRGEMCALEKWLHLTLSSKT